MVAQANKVLGIHFKKVKFAYYRSFSIAAHIFTFTLVILNVSDYLMQSMAKTPASS